MKFFSILLQMALFNGNRKIMKNHSAFFFCCLRIKIIRSFTIYDAFPFIFYPTSKLRKLFPILEKAINNSETAIAKKRYEGSVFSITNEIGRVIVWSFFYGENLWLFNISIDSFSCYVVEETESEQFIYIYDDLVTSRCLLYFFTSSLSLFFAVSITISRDSLHTHFH